MLFGAERILASVLIAIVIINFNIISSPSHTLLLLAILINKIDLAWIWFLIIYLEFSQLAIPKQSDLMQHIIFNLNWLQLGASNQIDSLQAIVRKVDIYQASVFLEVYLSNMISV